ncbi:MAG: aminotransferase class I/II-fold pyridoxal phosphate-dependent enzyme, partial [Solirubrobacterales bacterium]|nr:aminotransferase class I/II-fold pyridoxal phosphate-dependent enzyme [Solirubrobacterales bacterium]
MVRRRVPPPPMARLPAQFFTGVLADAARERERPGPPVIDLGRGNPDLPPPAHAIERLQAAAAQGAAIHGYPPFQGTPALREALAARYAADHGVTLDPETEIALVPGTKTGIMLTVLAAAGAGETVLLPDPGYPDYRSAVALAGATDAPLPLRPETNWQPDFDAAPDAALTVLNYPSNPCAVCAAPGTFEAAVARVGARGGWLLNDLAYGFLAFDAHRAPSLLAVPGAREVGVELWSASKVYGMAGWR